MGVFVEDGLGGGGFNGGVSGGEYLEVAVNVIGVDVGSIVTVGGGGGGPILGAGSYRLSLTLGNIQFRPRSWVSCAYQSLRKSQCSKVESSTTPQRAYETAMTCRMFYRA